MTGRFVVIAGAFVALGAAPAAAQEVNSQCVATITQDACQKAVDLFSYMAPQLGTMVVGGNPTLGQGETLGGFPRFSVGLRGTAIHGSLPNVRDHSPAMDGAQQTTYEPKSQMLALPGIEAALGLFGGIPLGLTKVGGVDLLLGAYFVPEYESSNLDIRTPDGGLRIAYGARVGVLQESLLWPGVSATWMKRDLPPSSITASYASGSLSVSDLSVETTSWRVVTSKNFFLVGFAAGAGQDRYRSGATVQGSVDTFDSEQLVLVQDLTRTSFFGNVSLNLLVAKLVAEVGQVSGGEVPTYNQFEGKKADDARIYGSVGVRIGL